MTSAPAPSNSALSTPLQLADWRRRVQELYAGVRNAPDPATGHQWWRQGRDKLFAGHPQSPLPAGDPLRSGLPYWPYDPQLRWTLPLLPARQRTQLSVSTGDDDPVVMSVIGRVELRAPLGGELSPVLSVRPGVDLPAGAPGHYHLGSGTGGRAAVPDRRSLASWMFPGPGPAMESHGTVGPGPRCPPSVRRFAVTDLLDITHKVLPVAVVGPGGVGPLPAYTDGHHYYFDDDAVALAGAQLSGLLDLAGRTVTVKRSTSGWQEFRGRQERPLHQRHIAGRQVFRFDDEWLFTVVRPGDAAAS